LFRRHTALFRRHTSDEPAPETPDKPDGKGRPTPSRKEAEAAARERARLPRDKKALARRQRELRGESSRKLRQAMRDGDEKNMLARDKGPVRRFVRDLVDARIGFSELLAPMLILILLLGYTTGGAGARFANALWYTTLLLVIVDVVVLRMKVRRQVRRRFPEEPLKGLTLYAVMRAMNLRFLRMPKPQVKIGQQLPETYR
jgi:hypothetical protein